MEIPPSPKRAALWLRRPIPAPAPPVAKPQATFHLLKVGQWLRTTLTLAIGVVTLPPDQLWQVIAVNSLGATVQAHATTIIMNINTPDWKARGLWTRARKPRAPKPPRSTPK